MSNGYELCLDEGILGIDGCVKNDFGLSENKKFNLKKVLDITKIICIIDRGGCNRPPRI